MDSRFSSANQVNIISMQDLQKSLLKIPNLNSRSSVLGNSSECNFRVEHANTQISIKF